MAALSLLEYPPSPIDCEVCVGRGGELALSFPSAALVQD